ncbi:hypothetical protein K488DRAFT_86835 [Vararia minispora EC-137]|uniref:Uncharacterized protein n=1 Tax=Vararia minispora EC-137 TaxID=1314806 RepID=A0ACB8QJA4_9AGAM|nr:hypothetical protein K488DRAFT_86835 [Vararia minispora EC-137]
MGDYDFRPGGSLKLKGAAVDGGVKKKKHKSKSKAQIKEEILKSSSPTPGSASGSGRNSPATGATDESKTEAEKRFQAAQRKRLSDKIKREAGKTHKDRVHEFNQKLEALSEHHDIPKVGPG